MPLWAVWVRQLCRTTNRAPRIPEFRLCAGFDVYTYRMENVPFYNLKKPYFQFQYLESGQKKFREANFGLTVAHNISPSTGFNLNYKSRGTNGLYEWQKTKNQNLRSLSHIRANAIRSMPVISTTTWRCVKTAVSWASGPFAIRSSRWRRGVPMKLTNYEAQNIYRNNAFFVEQSFGIPLVPVTERDFSIANLPVVYVGHSFEYNTWSKVYTDVKGTYTDERYSRDEEGNFVSQSGLEYYKNWFINPAQSRDSLYERVISNRIYVQAQPWDRNGVIGTLNGGVGVDLHTYSQFGMETFLTGRYERVHETSYFVYGSIEARIKRYVDWGADAKFYPSGYRGGDMSIGANLTLTGFIRNRPLILTGRSEPRNARPVSGRRIYSLTTTCGILL